MLGVTMFHITQFVMGVRMMEDTDNANSPILQTIATMIAAWNTFRWVQRAPSAPARVKMKNGKLDLGFLPAEIESKIQPSASLLQDSFGVPNDMDDLIYGTLWDVHATSWMDETQVVRDLTPDMVSNRRPTFYSYVTA